MQIRGERMVADCSCGQVHRDEHGTRFLGIPAWAICLTLIAVAPVAMLAYTTVVR